MAAKPVLQSVELPAQAVERFRRQLDLLIKPGIRIGIAVSGGPDSMALLLLANAARPGEVEAATVDHALRPGAAKEAAMVSALCQSLGIPHTTLVAQWAEKPTTAVQERARAERYRLLGQWAVERDLKALLAGHHADDQAETLLMRLARGAGVNGLAGMRRVARVPGATVPVIRPLLDWRHSDLEQLCTDAGITPVSDPSNEDDQFERVRVRKAIGNADWLDAKSLATSATNLAQADAALQWATTQEWNRGVSNGGGNIIYQPGSAPREIRRRIAGRAVMQLATEGKGVALRGPELERLLNVLAKGGKATLRGVLCSGGKEWRFNKAPQRKERPAAQ